MKPILPFLKQMITAPGLSGNEAPIRRLIRQTWEPLVDEISISPLGSLYGVRHGRAPLGQDAPVPQTSRPTILFAAHMDAIGLMASSILDGFIRIAEIGHLDHRILPGQMVTVHGIQDIPGVVALPAAHLLPPDLQGRPTPVEYLWVDTGLPAAEVSRLVHPGDLISFAQQPLELGNDLIAGHSLDNRASVAALTIGLQELQHRQCTWDVLAAATVQEEETLGGAYTAGFHLRPTLAIAVDVTFGSGPNSNGYQTFPLNKGVTLGWGPNIHPYLHKIMKEVADELEIPTATEFMPRDSGTDAIALQIAAEGTPTMVLSIPLRYMHTPLEIVSLTDIGRAGRLIAEFAARLDDDTMKNITWDI